MAYLEVIGKDDDLLENTTRVLMLETKFSALGKTLGDVPGANWKTLSAGNKLSTQALLTLNSDQKSLQSRFNTFKTAFNDWLSTKNIPNLSRIDYNMGITDWALKYIPNVTPASYQQVLTDIAGSEKKLYEVLTELTNSKFVQNQNAIKEWSKDKLYGSNCDSFVSGLSAGDTDVTSWIIENYYGPLHVSVAGGFENNKSKTSASNLQALKVGQSSRWEVRGMRGGSVLIQYFCTLTRHSLGSGISEDDGYFTYSFGNPDAPNSGGFHLKRVVSPHFENNNPTFPWLKNRKYL